MLFFPILGERRPDLVSFLPSLRQYSGNWATGVLVLRAGGGGEAGRVHRQAGPDAEGTSSPTIYGEDEAEVILQQFLGWRSMHTQSRGLNSVMINQLGDDIDVYTPREAEFMLQRAHRVQLR